MQSVPLVFYSDWMEIINELPDDQQLKVYKALTAYAFNGEMPDDPVIRAITALMFKFIDKDRKKYQRAKEQRRNAAKKRWDSRKDGEPSDTEECARTAPDADGIHNHNNINIEHKHENINNRQQGCNSVCAHKEPPKPEKEIEPEIEECKKNHIWKEAVCQKFRLASADELDPLLDDFALDMKCKERKVKNVKSLFTFWLGEELTKRIKNNSKTVTCHEDNKRDRFSARRGTEPRTQGRKNFKGTF